MKSEKCLLIEQIQKHIMAEKVIVDKSYLLALKITKFCLEMQDKRREFVISRQLLKSSTSVGANIEEAQGAISKAEFIMKVQIAYKEAIETRYWLRLIKDAEVYQDENSEQILKDCNEIIFIITAILKSSRLLN